MTWLLGARAFLSGIPKWVWGALGIVLAVIAFMVWLDGEKDKAVEADRARGNVEAVSKGRKADEGAHEATSGKIEAVEAGNRAASDAASKSDDPLKAGLDKLREEGRD